MSPFYYQTQQTSWEMMIDLIDSVAFPCSLVLCVLIVSVAYVVAKRGER